MKEFIQKPDPRTVLIVDALNLGFRWKHNKKKIFAEEYLATVESLARSYKAGTVLIACDSGQSSYRKSIYPEYKANRIALREQQTEQEKKEFEEFITEFNRTIEIIKDTEYPVLKYQGVEADDIAAYTVTKYKNDFTFWLASSDKDWDLLISENTSRFSYVTRKEITLDNWKEHYEYNPDDHISIKCLTGDSGDNIPGVSGIGSKRAIDLIRDYGSTYDIIASIPIDSKYKYINNINSFGAENLLRNYKLMDLVTYSEEAVGEENCKQIDKIMENIKNG